MIIRDDICNTSAKIAPNYKQHFLFFYTQIFLRLVWWRNVIHNKFVLSNRACKKYHCRVPGLP